MPPHTDDEEDGSESVLAEALERLTDEVTTMRQAIDDLREELAWEIRQLREGTPEWKARFHLTSMPVDATLPDFHRRVNAVDSSVFAVPATTLQDLMQRLTSEVSSSRLAADDWVEDQEFTPGEVVEIDAAIRDWFAEYLVIVKREADWFLADDGEGWFYVLWSRGERCYLRLLTDEELQDVCRLTGIEPETNSADAAESLPEFAAAPDPPPAASQRSLW